MPLSIGARRQQGLVEIGRLCSEFVTWRQKTQLPQYTTQLDAIDAEVRACAERLRQALGNLGSTSPVGEGYAVCTRTERQIAWLWRAWDFFRSKFDQRLNPEYRDTLRAADEVVWSCYRPCFKQPLSERVPDPAPLPYIEMEYSPVAIRPDQAAVIGGRPNQQELLALAFQKLPTPILKLPVSAIANPWVLALTAHETGHFVQRMVSAKPLEFVAAFKDLVERAAGDSEWGPWAAEIFADWYSVLTMGQWSLHPIAQFGAGDTRLNTKRGGVYPSLLVRLSLMAALADLYGFPGTQALDKMGIDLPQKGDFPEYDADVIAIPAVAKAIYELPECRTLARQLDPRPENFKPGGLASQWAAHIRSGATQPESQKSDSARLVAAGAVQAWDQFVFTSVELPDEATIDGLRARTRDAMRQAAMPGVRASLPSPSLPEEKPGDVLWDFLNGL
jgi:hypothetical protein